MRSHNLFENFEKSFRKLFSKPVHDSSIYIYHLLITILRISFSEFNVLFNLSHFWSSHVIFTLNLLLEQKSSVPSKLLVFDQEVDNLFPNHANNSLRKLKSTIETKKWKKKLPKIQRLKL